MKTALLALVAFAGSTFAQEAPPAPRAGGVIKRADTNRDGVVTRAEALALAGARFDRMDVNHDGKLTADEMALVGKRMRGSAVATCRPCCRRTALPRSNDPGRPGGTPAWPAVTP